MEKISDQTQLDTSVVDVEARMIAVVLGAMMKKLGLTEFSISRSDVVEIEGCVLNKVYDVAKETWTFRLSEPKP